MIATMILDAQACGNAVFIAKPYPNPDHPNSNLHLTSNYFIQSICFSEVKSPKVNIWCESVSCISKFSVNPSFWSIWYYL